MRVERFNQTVHAWSMVLDGGRPACGPSPPHPWTQHPTQAAIQRGSTGRIYPVSSHAPGTVKTENDGDATALAEGMVPWQIGPFRRPASSRLRAWSASNGENRDPARSCAGALGYG